MVNQAQFAFLEFRELRNFLHKAFFYGVEKLKRDYDEVIQKGNVRAVPQSLRTFNSYRCVPIDVTFFS